MKPHPQSTISAVDFAEKDPLRVNQRILIVDDNSAIHEDFRKILSPADYGEADLDLAESAVFGHEIKGDTVFDFQLAFAAQGEGAVKLAEMALQQGRPFALALVDVRMPPGMDGVETIKALWKIQPDMQIAICTAYADYSWDDIARHLGVTHRLMILKKPFDPIEVIQIANALTTKWAYERESALRQLGLQTRLWEHTRRIEDACSRLNKEHQERLRLVEDMRRMQKMDSLGALAAGIAHDFNNVLTVIQSQLSMSLMSAEQPQGIAESMEEVLLAARHAADLTDRLLKFSRREFMPPVPLQLDQAIENETALLKRSLGPQITLEISHAPDLPDVVADPGSLGQIIINLALNARDAMPQGGRVAISSRFMRVENPEDAKSLHAEARAGEFAVISVSDTGTGMPPEVLDRIFDPFFTTKGAGRGSGMGLFVVRGLVRHMGGWVTVSSVPGVGTDFQIYLPVIGSELPADDSEKPGRDFDGLSMGVPPCTILIVDDDSSVRHVVSSVLRAQGHSVLTAKDADEAWKCWASHRQGIHLVIADINLPGKSNGFDLGRAVLAEDSSVPFIFTSGSCPDIVGQTGKLQLGINYLPKPFDVLDLLNAVGHALADTPSCDKPPAPAKTQTAKIELARIS
ncbi:MAG TPA: hypothetical protein DIT13_08610 [Verrucomicrobiales bacterium]|nr:hypothetical protein [Verrucomicrobiales bacterium]HRJ08643.1 response regulator [Prosthecobacter sp.]HRK13899.1 response regulator [Prosthecobacter sp.]